MSGFTSNYNQTTQTYASLPPQSGLAVGQVYDSPNLYQSRMLVQNNPSGSTLAVGAALKWTTAQGPGTKGQGAYQVDATTATTDVCVGVNDASGGTVAAGVYFWMTFKGIANPLQVNGTGQGQVLAPSATTGVLQQSAGDFQGNIWSTAAQSGGGNTQTAAWFA